MRSVKYMFMLLVASSLMANPVFETFLNEIKTGPGSSEWLELHQAPEPMYFGDIGGWSIVTHEGTAIVNSDNILDTFYLVIDESNTSGTFSLNDVADTLKLYDEYGQLLEWVIWGDVAWDGIGMLGPSSFPTPPADVSASRFNSMGPSCAMGWMDQYITWYFDLTPTPGEANDGTGSIEGSVYDPDGNLLDGVLVTADGPMGYQSWITCWEGIHWGMYWLLGLGEGNYWVTAYHPAYGTISPPDSVYVSEGETITLDFHFSPGAVSERIKEAQGTPHLNVAAGGAVVNLEEGKYISLKLIDVSGRIMERVFTGYLDQGTHYFKISTSTSGVYFLELRTRNKKVVEKIIVP